MEYGHNCPTFESPIWDPMDDEEGVDRARALGSKGGKKEEREEKKNGKRAKNLSEKKLE